MRRVTDEGSVHVVGFVLVCIASRACSQNPEACARLGADLAKAFRDLITAENSPAEAVNLVNGMLEMRRMTGDPCYLPPRHPGQHRRR
jgi:hypothetical protein